MSIAFVQTASHLTTDGITGAILVGSVSRGGNQESYLKYYMQKRNLHGNLH